MIRPKVIMFYIFFLLISMHEQSACASQGQTKYPYSYPGQQTFQNFKQRKTLPSCGSENLGSRNVDTSREGLLPEGARWSDELWGMDECESNSRLLNTSAVQFEVDHLAPLPVEIAFTDVQKVAVNHPSSQQLRSDLINILIYKIKNPNMTDFSADLFYVPEIFKDKPTGRKFLLFGCAKKLVVDRIHGVEVLFTDRSKILLHFDPERQLWNCQLVQSE